MTWHIYWHNGTAWPASPSFTYYYVYDHWNPVLEWRDAGGTNYKYTWGLDLSGSIHGAGGVGGLLAWNQSSGGLDDKWFFYDGNGNVTQLLNKLDSSVASHCEYDPFGKRIVAAGSYSLIGFSTKWTAPDPCSGAGQLYYYGYRWYTPRTGRWLSRDPIAEQLMTLFNRRKSIPEDGHPEYSGEDGHRASPRVPIRPDVLILIEAQGSFTGSNAELYGLITGDVSEAYVRGRDAGGGLNAYQYVLGDPLAAIDPIGLDTLLNP